MFNALGLGFSFVLSFLILPEADGTLSEERNNDAFNDNVIIITIMIIIKGWNIIGGKRQWHRLFKLNTHSPRSQSGLWIQIFVSDTFKPLKFALSTIIGSFSFLQENILKLFPLTIATKVESFNSLMTLQYVHAGNPNSYYQFFVIFVLKIMKS